MDKKYKAFQIYALVICVVSVITFLITVGNLIVSIIDRQNPEYAERFDVHLSSYENFKMETLKSTNKDEAYIPDDTIMLKMYNSAKDEKIKSVMHFTSRSITVNTIVLVIAVILFVGHVFLIKVLSKRSEINTSSKNDT